jgi:hypothetical protein
MDTSVPFGIGGSGACDIDGCGVGAVTRAGREEVPRGEFCTETGEFFGSFGFEGRRSAGNRRRKPIK